MCHPLESHFSFGSLLRIPTRNVQIRCELILVSFCAFVSKSASATGNLPSSAGFLTIPTVDSNRINHCCHFSERWHHKIDKETAASIMALTSPGIALDKAVLQSMHLAGSKDMSRLCQTAQSATVVFTDLLLACCLVNATCAVANVMTTLIFIIVSRLHAFFLVAYCPLIPPRTHGSCGNSLFPTQLCTFLNQTTTETKRASVRSYVTDRDVIT